MKKYLIILLVSPFIVGFDQLSKYVVCQFIPLHRRIEVIQDFFHLVHVRNPGIAFGLFNQFGSRFKTSLLIAISVAAIFFIVYLIREIKEGDKLQLWCFALILGGAIGNLIDRFHLGEVIDFIDLHWYFKYHWPAFNVADSAITIGIVLLVLEALWSLKGKKRISKKEH